MLQFLAGTTHGRLPIRAALPIASLLGFALHVPDLPAQELDQDIEEIVVTENLEESIPLDLSRYGSQVQVVTAGEIRMHGFADVGQALQMLVPGLHIAPKNGPFDYVTASLQGSRREDILWLVDGVRITNRLYNGTSPLDTIPAHMVERIEILKGGQGIFYGTQSVGGVINIVTLAVGSTTGGRVGLGAHSNDGLNLHGAYRGGTDRHRFAVFGSRDDAGGYLPYRRSDLQPSSTDRERGYEVTTGGLKYAWLVSDDTRLSLSLIHTDADLDFARPFLNRRTVNARDEDIATIKFDHRINENVGVFVKAYRHDWETEYTRIYNELDANGELTGGVVVRNDRSFWGYEDYGFNAMAEFNFGGLLEYVVGVDQQNFSGEDEVWRIADQEEKVTAGFVQLRTTDRFSEDTHLALGARHNAASNMEDSTVWNLTARHGFGNEMYLLANIGTSFRMPDAEALFLNEYYDDDNDGVPDGGWFAIGNPNLEPEESRNLNVSLGRSGSRLSFELTYFRREISNYINSYVPITIGGVVGETFVNGDDEVDISGFELQFAAVVNDNWSGELSITSTDARFNGAGPQVTGIPETEAKLAIVYQRPDSPFAATLAANYVGDVTDREPRGEYMVADIAGSWRFGDDDRHELVLRFENIFDERYSTSVGVGTIDATGESYFYDNLGMERTLHLNYSRAF